MPRGERSHRAAAGLRACVLKAPAAGERGNGNRAKSSRSPQFLCTVSRAADGDGRGGGREREGGGSDVRCFSAAVGGPEEAESPAQELRSAAERREQIPLAVRPCGVFMQNSGFLGGPKAAAHRDLRSAFARAVLSLARGK